MRPHAVVVLTRPARAGAVKTRLAAAVGGETAAALHQAFLDDVLAALGEGAGRFEVAVAWSLAAGEVAPVVPGVRSFAQVAGDLGARMHAALATLAAEPGRRGVAVVGSDHPELAAATLDDAFARLDAGADVVLGPAADGGYFLLAVRPRALSPELFAGLAWSNPGVLAAQRARAEALGLAVETLPVGHDVDTVADLRALARRLAARAGGCGATRAALARLGLAGGAGEDGTAAAVGAAAAEEGR